MQSHVLAMFPGQGSQHVGMCRDLLSQFPSAGRVFEEASDAIKYDLKRVCIDGPDDELTLTANTQPSILTTSFAMWTVLSSELPLNPKYFAGHSLGEYSAAVASAKLAFNRAVMLVRRRGEAMQAAVAPGVGAMAAVLNCPAKDLEDLCKKASTKDVVVEAVNFNSPQQIVVAGHKKAVDQLLVILAEKNIKAVPLAVSAPFHSKLMKPAREVMTPLLNDTEFADTDTEIIANTTALAIRDYNQSYLIEQIDHPVRWTQSMQTSEQLGTNVYIEIGPGKVLSGLAKRCLASKDAKIFNSTDIRKLISDLSAIIS
jgi:[acyl-carrier-protein] S-malonyltransferase